MSNNQNVPVSLPAVAPSKGSYRIKIEEVKELHQGKGNVLGGKCDPYVVVKIGSTAVKTSSKKDKVATEFGDVFSFQVDSKGGKVVVEVWDENDFGNHTLCGCSSLDLADSVVGSWIELTDEKNVKVGGQVKLSVTYAPPAQPAPAPVPVKTTPVPSPVPTKTPEPSKKKEGGLLGFLQEYGWLVYIVSLLSVIVYKYMIAGKPLRIPLPAQVGSVLMKAGDFIGSESHHLILNVQGNLALFEGSAPAQEAKLLWESATNIKCPKCVTFLSETGMLQIKNGRKVVYEVPVADHPELGDLLPTQPSS